jgi:hypothetical protein
MALTTIKVREPRVAGAVNYGSKDAYTSYVALDPAEYTDVAAATRAVVEGYCLNDKYIWGLLTTTQIAYLEAKLTSGSTTIDLVAMP